MQANRKHQPTKPLRAVQNVTVLLQTDTFIYLHLLTHFREAKTFIDQDETNLTQLH